MKRVHELDVYKLAEELSDMVWQDFDQWYKSMKTQFPFSNFREQVLSCLAAR